MLLQNVLRATTACTFSTSQFPNVVRECCALTLFTSKCASRHNGVQFFISHLASPAALASLPFDPPEPQNTGKTQCFAIFLPFRAPASSLFSLSPSLIFSLLTFSTSEFLPGCAISISPYWRKFSFQTSFDYSEQQRPSWLLHSRRPCQRWPLLHTALLPYMRWI